MSQYKWNWDQCAYNHMLRNHYIGSCLVSVFLATYCRGWWRKMAVNQFVLKVWTASECKLWTIPNEPGYVRIHGQNMPMFFKDLTDHVGRIVVGANNSSWFLSAIVPTLGDQKLRTVGIQGSMVCSLCLTGNLHDFAFVATLNYCSFTCRFFPCSDRFCLLSSV